MKTIGEGPGTENGQMNQPIVVCIDYENSYLLVADYSNNRVQVFDKESGEFVLNIGDDSGPNAMNGPRGLCVCSECELLFVSDRENHRIHIYNKNTFVLIRHLGDVHSPGIQPGQFNRPMELCCSAEDGVLLVVDGYNHRVQILELPELHTEKVRLRALKASRLAKALQDDSIPKSSRLALKTEITAENVILSKDLKTAVLNFNSYGSIFDIYLHDDELYHSLDFVQSLQVIDVNKVRITIY